MTVTPIAPTANTVESAIAFASRKTGIDFDYLLGQAQVESGLNASAKAGTSSASGLYQFIDQSWLSVVKKHGAEHGLGWAAAAIEPGVGGRLSVSDPATRQSILALRNNPSVASLMAAEHAADNKSSLEGALGRAATGTDLYMAHFLGLGGAQNFLQTLSTNPDKVGAALFPAAARANRNVFYASNGQPRTVSEIYQRFSAKLDSGAAAGGATGIASDALRGNSGRQDLAGTEIIPGNGEGLGAATRWARAALNGLGAEQGTLDQLNGGLASLNRFGAAGARAEQLLRPTPDTARIAYLMLASLGG
ncbi:MAG: lytic transglycosylase domain-containing protein [Sphingomonas sp.]